MNPTEKVQDKCFAFPIMENHICLICGADLDAWNELGLGEHRHFIDYPAHIADEVRAVDKERLSVLKDSFPKTMKGKLCPHCVKPHTCEELSCEACQIWLDWKLEHPELEGKC